MSQAVYRCYRLAEQLGRLVERDGSEAVEISIVDLGHGDEAAQARWVLGPRKVLVTLHPGYRVLSCLDGFATVWRAELNKNGVDSLRRALAWLCDEVTHPREARR